MPGRASDAQTIRMTWDDIALSLRHFLPTNPDTPWSCCAEGTSVSAPSYSWSSLGIVLIEQETERERERESTWRARHLDLATLLHLFWASARTTGRCDQATAFGDPSRANARPEKGDSRPASQGQRRSLLISCSDRHRDKHRFVLL